MRIRIKIKEGRRFGIADWGSGIEEIKNRKRGPREGAKKFLFTAEAQRARRGASREIGVSR